MSGHRPPRHGEGTAWLVADRPGHDFLCYWYVGSREDRLAERARVADAAAAVAWGGVRTSRVRLRADDGRTYWAGTAPRPKGIGDTWPTEGGAPC